MTDKWAEYKEKFCGCKDASRLNSCRGLHNCELPVGHPERKQAQSAEPVQGEAVEMVAYLLKHDSGARLVDINSQSMQIAQHLHGGHIHKLITLDQHNRIMAAAKPDAELVELLRDERNYGPLGISCQVGMVERCVCKMCRMKRIDAKLAEVNKQ